MSRCVICGKTYSRLVTDTHLNSHKISRKKHDELAAALPADAWDYYWENEPVRRIFPNPTGSRVHPWKGFLTYETWGQDRHPEWQ